MAEGQSTTVSEVEYRDIPEHPGYRVGDDGSVWSCWEQVRLPGTRNGFESVVGTHWKKLSLGRHNDGHLMASLRGKSFLVHRLVLSAFVGPCPDGMQGCHYPDRDPTNNRLENLRWDTPKGNGQDKVRHGTSLKGEKNHKAKLTEQQVIDIRSRPASQSTLAISREFGVSDTLIRLIRQGRIWQHADVKVGTKSSRSRSPSHFKSKLTEDEVRAIRAEYAAGGTTFKNLGAKYNVTAVMVRHIVRRKAWRHVA